MKGAIINNLRRYKLNSLLVRVTAVILLGTALFNVIMGVSYHRKSYEQIRGEVNKTNAEVLRRAMVQWDEWITLINTNIMQLANSRDVLQLISGIQDPYEKLAALDRLQRQITLLTSGDSYIRQAYLYFAEGDWIIDSLRTSHGQRHSDQAMMQRMTSAMEAYSGRFSIVMQSHQQSADENSLIILFPLPLRPTEKNGCIAFELDIGLFSQAVGGQGIGWLDGLALVDKDGQILLPIAGKEEALPILAELMGEEPMAESYHGEGRSYWVQTHHSPVTGWRGVGIVDQSAFDSYVMVLTRAIVSIMLLATLGIVIGAYLLFMRLYAPLARMQDRFGRHDAEAKNELISIERHVDAALDENQRLDTLFNDNLAAIRESFLLKLLRAPVEREDEEAIAQRGALYQLKVNLFTPYVLLFTLVDISPQDRETQLDTAELHTLRILGRLRGLPNPAEHVLYQHNIILTVLNIPGYSTMKKAIGAYAQGIASAYEVSEGLQWRMLASGYCEEPSNAAAAYGECVRALPIGFSLSKSQVTFLDELELGRLGGSDFILEAKAEISLLLQTDGDRAVEVLDRTWQQIGGYGNPERLLDFFIAQLIGTLEFEFVRKDAPPAALTEKLRHLYGLFCGERDYARIQVCLRELLLGIASALREQKSAHHRQTVLLAEDYIRKNYHQDISLEDVADAVMLSPAYFSRVFSECMGISYKEYLTNLRIAAAKELLLETEDIAQVMGRSGFTNLSTFHRVFKKHTGLPPGEYRAAKKRSAHEEAKHHPDQL